MGPSVTDLEAVIGRPPLTSFKGYSTIVLVAWLLGCDGRRPTSSPPLGGDGGQRQMADAHWFGETEVPGLDASLCAAPAPAPNFALNPPSAPAASGPYWVLTGTLPLEIDGSPVASVSVNGEQRGVRSSDDRRVFTYFTAAPRGPLTIAAEAVSGTTLTQSLDEQPPATARFAARDLGAQHSVGAWMFAWFSGDASFQCRSAWQPLEGFAAWDGSVTWAQGQLLDQADAHLDMVGIQLETSSNEGAEGYRFDNVQRVLTAARGLLREGVLPPRLLPLLDTARIARHYAEARGTPLDLSQEAARSYFYGHVSAFFRVAATTLDVGFEAAIARFQGGSLAVALGPVGTASGIDDAFVLDLKVRCSEELGAACYLIGDEDGWGKLASIDEVTRMQPARAHAATSRAPNGYESVSLFPGAWDPMTHASYLPREGGRHFEQAWQTAQTMRERARHVWIDTWNETQGGTGIFSARASSYSAADTGPCSEFVDTHADAWGDDPRRYIDVTAREATLWNDAIELDAEPVVSDVPDTMRAGESRYVTVVMRNTGDATWRPADHRLGLTFSAAARDFHLAAMGVVQTDPWIERFGGVARGMPGVYTVRLTAPCAPGTYLVAFEIYDRQYGGFGSQLQRDIRVTP